MVIFIILNRNYINGASKCILMKKQLGQKIQMLRKKLKLTQEQFSELVGIDPKNVSKIENGNNYPSAETLTSIADALGVDIYELFVFKEEIPYTRMKQEIINALEDKKTILYLYQMLLAK